MMRSGNPLEHIFGVCDILATLPGQGAALRKIGDWLRDHIVVAIVVAALSASAVAYLRGVFDIVIGGVLPKGAEIACAGREWAAGHWSFRQHQAPADAFRVLVATLDGDDASGTFTHAVVRAFQGQRGIDAVSTCRVLNIPGAGLTVEATAAKTDKNGWPRARQTS